MNFKSKSEISEYVKQQYISNNGFLAVYNATGTGKSAAALNCLNYYHFKNPEKVNLIVCHSEPARDSTWPAELSQWSNLQKGEKLMLVCYKSLPLIKDLDFGLVILDEAHYITPLSYTFFKNNKVDSIIALTATEPEEDEKIEILQKLTKGNKTEYRVDQAISDGILNNFELHVFYISLNSKNKYLQYYKSKPNLYTEEEYYLKLTSELNNIQNKIETLKQQLLDFVFSNNEVLEEDNFSCLFRICNKIARSNYQKVLDSFKTEEEKHAYLVKTPNYELHKVGSTIDTLIESFKISKFLTMKRMHFIYNLESKTNAATFIANKLRSNNRRFLIFCSNKNQCNKMSEFRMYTGYEKKKKDYLDFKNKKLNELASCKQIQEGDNIQDLDAILMVQIQAKIRSMIQRLGRLLRRENDFTSKAYAIVAKNTQDEVWFKNATSSIDKKRIIEHYLN